jgi:signal transduction histidine kinase
MSDFDIFVSMVTSAGFLGLAITAMSRGRRHPMALPFGQLTTMLAFYKLFEPASDISGNPLWDTLEFTAATLAAPPLLGLLSVFLGISRRLRWVLRLVVLYFVAVAGLLLAREIWPGRVHFPNARWSGLMLVGLLPTAIPLFGLTVYRWIGSTGEQRLRSQLILAALLLGVGGVLTDLMALAGYDVPRLSDLGLVASVLPLGLVAFEIEVVKRPGGVAIATIAALSLFAVVVQLVVFALAGGEMSVFAAGSVATMVVLVATLRPILVAQSENRHRQHHLATLGRLSEQMAHDLRNPLAALTGSVDLLKEELRRAGALESSRRYLDLIESQAKRMHRVVDDYRRLGSVNPVIASVEPHRLVRRVAEGFRASLPEEMELDVHAPTVGPVRCDPDLLEVALENLLRNAREALAGHGRVELRLDAVQAWWGRKLRFSVRDEGPGMDSATAEQAFDEAFTTKARGTGLGLSYVRRVAEAHGGTARLSTQPDRGTTVWIEIPWRPAEAVSSASEPERSEAQAPISESGSSSPV